MGAERVEQGLKGPCGLGLQVREVPAETPAVPWLGNVLELSIVQNWHTPSVIGDNRGEGEVIIPQTIRGGVSAQAVIVCATIEQHSRDFGIPFVAEDLSLSCVAHSGLVRVVN